MQILLDKVKRSGNRKLGNGKPGNGKTAQNEDYYTTLNHSEEQLLRTYGNFSNLKKQKIFDF